MIPQMAQPIMYNPLNSSNQFQMMAPAVNFQGIFPNMYQNMISSMGQPQFSQPQGIV